MGEKKAINLSPGGGRRGGIPFLGESALLLLSSAAYLLADAESLLTRGALLFFRLTLALFAQEVRLVHGPEADGGCRGISLVQAIFRVLAPDIALVFVLLVATER